MQFSQSIEIARPRDEVWELFQDVPRVVGRLPGATLTEDPGDGTYASVMTTRLGPVTAHFAGDGKLDVDQSAHCGRLEGNGRDRKAGSRAKATSEYRLEATDGRHPR